MLHLTYHETSILIGGIGLGVFCTLVGEAIGLYVIRPYFEGKSNG